MTRKLYLASSAVLVIALLAYLYADSLVFLFGQWESEDYSHGMFVPLISLFLIWQARHLVAQAVAGNSWWGLAVISTGLILYGIGELATLYVLQHVSLWMVIVGLVIASIGIRGARAIAFPLSYLLTSIPLPVFLYASVASQLQLWSSALGVGCLQLVGVTAFREGNVIDLGPVQLQVVEACSGIRYLLPLVSLALLCAYLFKDRMWKRVVLVLSSVPISIVVNGFRIGIIGVLVEWYGAGAAEGFYHLFEGWVLFMASLVLLILETWVLFRMGRMEDRSSFFDRFTWNGQRTDVTVQPLHSSSLATAPTGSRIASSIHSPSSRKMFPSHAYLCSVALLVPVSFASTLMTERVEVTPPRAMFVDFPMTLDGWRGTSPLVGKAIHRRPPI